MAKKRLGVVAAVVLGLAVLGSAGKNKKETVVEATPRPTVVAAATAAPAKTAKSSVLELAPAETSAAPELSRSAPTPSPTPKPTPSPTPEPVTRTVEQTYILNTNTKKFHLPGCSSVGKMKESNKREYTGTRDDVLGMGYSPCGNCHP